MPAYLIANVDIKDTEKFKEYMKAVAESELMRIHKVHCFTEIAKWAYQYKFLLFSDLKYYFKSLTYRNEIQKKEIR